MNKEHEFVIKPLLKYFKNNKNNWKVHTPDYPTSATGWDIEARCKKFDLLIEAKFMGGPFISKLNGLVTAPLVKRKCQLPKSTKPSFVCWALGAKNMKRNPYQLLLDYFVRNPKFWVHYQKDLNIKYVFIVNNGEVTRIDFTKFLEVISKYKKLSENVKLVGRREIANNLIGKSF